MGKFTQAVGFQHENKPNTIVHNEEKSSTLLLFSALLSLVIAAVLHFFFFVVLSSLFLCKEPLFKATKNAVCTNFPEEEKVRHLPLGTNLGSGA